MTEKHEEFVFLQECIVSLNSAWSIIEALSHGDAHKTLAWAAFRMALVEYSKPYKKSVGLQVKRHVLPLPALSAEDRKLHERIVQLRDTVLAHSDLNAKDARLYIGSVRGKPFPMVVSDAPPSLPTASDVRGLIERSLDELYKQAAAWEAQLCGQP